MASSANYNHHPLPAPPPELDDYPPYERQQQPPQQYRHQPEYQSPQPQYQQYTSYQDQQQQELQQQLPPPLQPPPPSQQPQRIRPKSRAFSFRSDKSQKSANGPSHKNNLHETSAEKEAKRLHGKSDPRMAMTEREPAMEAQTVSERPALRAIQHRDSTGNPIAEPDRSNPTRSRWERPLDTIRSFEAAIDGGYNRKSVYRSDSDSVANWNRRSSYYGGNGAPPPQDGGPYGYGGGRPNRTDSGMLDYRQSAMIGGSRDSLYDGGYEGGQPGYGGSGMGSRNRYSRMQSEPHLNGRGRNVYPVPNNHRSYETVASGSGTGSTGDPMGYQTDPTSSENSSIDRRSPPKRQEPMNDYGISFGQSSNYQPSGFGIAPEYTMPHQQAPAVPRKDPGGAMLRKPSKATAANPQGRPDMGEKRKSWFMRRFSKNS